MSIIHGIRFFDDSSSCIAHFEKAHWTQKAVSNIQSYRTLALHVLHKINLLFYGAEAVMHPFTKSGSNGFSKKRLIVCIHGLNNNPSQFKTIVNELQKKNLPETDIFIPSVLKKGRAKLDEMAMPIVEKIAKWAKTKGNKELVLVGISNGGRISRAVEAELSKSENRGNITRLRVISIVGACRGSTLANLANKLRVSWLLPENISKEMPTDSNRGTKLHQDWVASLENTPDLERDYTFIASPHDWQVPNYDSTLSEVAKHNARYALVPGHGHNSIVDASARVVAEVIAGRAFT